MSSSIAADQSLRALVRERQAGFDGVGYACGGPAPPPAAIAARNVILVHGILERTHAKLSADETEVITEFVIRPFDVQRRDRLNGSSLPEEIVLEAVGGEIMIEGFPVSIRIFRLGRTIDFTPGQEVVILATHGLTTEHWVFDALGAFLVEHGTARSLGPVEHPRYELQAFLNTLNRALATRPPMQLLEFAGPHF